MDDQKKTIVIVDDDEDLLRLIATTFRAKGFEIVEFKTGDEAEKYLLSEESTKKVSLLILDRMLPDTDGVEILKKVQQKFPNAYPVLILSSLSSDKDVLEGLRIGAVDYVVKPFNMDILIQKASQLIR